MTQSEKLAEAVWSGAAWSVSQDLALEGDEDALTLSNLCAKIFEETEIEAANVAQLAADLDAAVEPDRRGQIHLIEVTVTGREDAKRLVSRLQRNGYVGWQDFGGAAAESFFRHEREVTLVRLQGTAFTVHVSWGKSQRANRIPVPLRPTANDHRAVDLPSKLWPAYLAVRPARLLRDRVRRDGQPRSSLGPILGTPESLLSPLFDFAGVTETDHLVDLGCGDGRVIVAAADQRGCSATGVEMDSRLVVLANKRVSESPTAANQVTVIEANADDHSLRDATVVFLFVPANEVSDAVYKIRSSGFEGRVISHEQQYTRGGLRPVESRVLVGSDAMTVAHLW